MSSSAARNAVVRLATAAAEEAEAGDMVEAVARRVERSPILMFVCCDPRSEEEILKAFNNI